LGFEENFHGKEESFEEDLKKEKMACNG